MRTSVNMCKTLHILSLNPLILISKANICGKKQETGGREIKCAICFYNLISAC